MVDTMHASYLHANHTVFTCQPHFGYGMVDTLHATYLHANFYNPGLDIIFVCICIDSL